jgi:hypothetical protein
MYMVSFADEFMDSFCDHATLAAVEACLVHQMKVDITPATTMVEIEDATRISVNVNPALPACRL